MQSLGVGRIPEDRHHDGVIGAMSVAENLIIERLNDKDINSRGFLQNKEINENAKELIEKYDIRGPGVDAKASLLSGGNIQKLILARVFECTIAFGLEKHLLNIQTGVSYFEFEIE